LPRKTQPPLSPFVKGDNAGLNRSHHAALAAP